MILYSQGCIFISKSAYDSNQRTQTDVAKMRVLQLQYKGHDGGNDLSQTTLHAAIRYK